MDPPENTVIFRLKNNQKKKKDIREKESSSDTAFTAFAEVVILCPLGLELNHVVSKTNLKQLHS